jgi:hypothetical protein
MGLIEIVKTAVKTRLAAREVKMLAKRLGKWGMLVSIALTLAVVLLGALGQPEAAEFLQNVITHSDLSPEKAVGWATTQQIVAIGTSLAGLWSVFLKLRSNYLKYKAAKTPAPPPLRDAGLASRAPGASSNS